MKSEIAGAVSTAKPQPVPAAPLVAEGSDAAATAEAEGRTGPRSPVVRFGADFDYTWPSRAMTEYKAGYQGRVKVEVAEAAEKAGVLVATVDDDTETK